MRLVQGLIPCAVSLMISGCALAPPPPPSTVEVDAAVQSLSGRLAIHVDASDAAPARSISASFELQGSAKVGYLNLSTPLGSVLARASWAPGSVLLVTPQGMTPLADLDALTREVLGESLPVAALFDWLNGRPWPGASSTLNVAPAAAGFEQLGWSVDLARVDEAWGGARRDQAPAVTVRVKLDRP